VASPADPTQYRDDPRWHPPQPPEPSVAPLPGPTRARHNLDLIRRRPGPPPTTTQPAGKTAAQDSYGNVLTVTALWYLLPILFGSFWLLLLDPDRRTAAYRDLLTNLPWEFSAFLLSLGVAALLRFASIGWRTWTMAFAATIIGAGLATVLHSFA
jgi:hypothetical protein